MLEEMNEDEIEREGNVYVAVDVSDDEFDCQGHGCVFIACSFRSDGSRLFIWSGLRARRGGRPRGAGCHGKADRKDRRRDGIGHR